MQFMITEKHTKGHKKLHYIGKDGFLFLFLKKVCPKFYTFRTHSVQ
jgi:hypothetical protein